ncbi:MAG TPA: Xaa-Pro peptidase family protein [Candidatus Micrarchaeaceae archaeon]|nr:Xaa-Pro peptidase family protein [Candidatus Micrarchaeaceae archaeon]
MTTTADRTKTGPKLARLQEIIERRNLDGIVLSSYQNVSYFGGTHLMTQVSLPDRLAFLVVPRASDPTLIVCGIETRQVLTQTDVADVRDYVEFAENPTSVLAAVLKERKLGAGSIGIDARRLPVASGELLQESLSGVELVSVDDDIELAQAVKDAREIAVLEAAAKATLAAAEETAAELRAGSTERDFSTGAFLKLMQKGGVPLFIVFASGPKTMQAHPESSDEPMQPGTLWRIDFGARFEEVINSDLARTGVVGEPSREQEATLIALRATQDAGFKAIEPGRPAKDVFNAVKDEFKRQGLPFSMPHIGHGMGIGLHEFPMLEPGNDIKLQTGMVLNIEPMAVVESRQEAYHTEDLAEVTPNGARLLTPPQQRLLRIRA